MGRRDGQVIIIRRDRFTTDVAHFVMLVRGLGAVTFWGRNPGAILRSRIQQANRLHPIGPAVRCSHSAQDFPGPAITPARRADPERNLLGFRNVPALPAAARRFTSRMVAQSAPSICYTGLALRTYLGRYARGLGYQLSSVVPFSFPSSRSLLARDRRRARSSEEG
ncbi:hypothetical protein BDY21DRAFT_359097 [Lineolata rhizophorae]|uniref:Uncharacterized protein n=1 Tax=Lineolata rhizophorae TaxID=578093 RepID=A0A6A6NLH9_9PEZI|nr:hypothetical protein BDY21DRAFT_359097 [Lineolata rhizophorae]